MAEGDPALTIRIRPAQTEKAFVFEDGVSEAVAVGSKSELNQVLFQQASLRDRLERLKQIGGGSLKLGPVQADEALQQLYETGLLVLQKLVNDDLDVLPALSRLVRGALGRGQLGGRTPWVHVTTPDNDPIAHSIPFELLPFMANGRPRSVAQDDSRLGEALDGFLGFATVVARDQGDLFDGSMIARHENRLPVKLFHNVSLGNAKTEMEFFTTRQDFDVDGPWPVAGLTPEVFLETMQAQIFDPSKRIDGSARPLADQIQHFACHCETFGDADSYRFILAADPGQPMPVTLGKLQNRLTELALNGTRSACEMPLVFLNACGAVAVDPRQLGSFVKFFLQNRNRGFIGAQTMIPDSTASEFSKTFYLGLLLQGMSVGEAVRNARRKLAERHYNLLGILYMHYGPAELRLAA
jgi:hypothetical protein